MCTPKAIDVRVLLKHGPHLYNLMKVERRGLDAYFFVPGLGLHYSVHKSGEAHFRKERTKRKAATEQPPVALVEGEAGIRVDENTIRTPIGGLGRADWICTLICPIDSPATDFREFNRSAEGCFVIDLDALPAEVSALEVGAWTVPERNEASFHFNNRDVPPDLLYKVESIEPQIWVYAQPF